MRMRTVFAMAALIVMTGICLSAQEAATAPKLAVTKNLKIWLSADAGHAPLAFAREVIHEERLAEHEDEIVEGFLAGQRALMVGQAGGHDADLPRLECEFLIGHHEAAGAGNLDKHFGQFVEVQALDNVHQAAQARDFQIQGSRFGLAQTAVDDLARQTV